MGRRDAPLGLRDAWVFERLAADYRARPGWPEPLVDRLAALAGGPGALVADLGAGTGSLAIPLAARGLRVVAVEPARAMLEVLQEAAGALPIEPVQATAERTGIAGGVAHLALVADALQWVDPDATGREVSRIVAPGGCVAVVEARLGGSPFADAVRDAIERANPRARPRPGSRRSQLLSCAGAPEEGHAQWTHEELLPPDRLEAVLRSLSVVGPALGPEGLRALLDAAAELARVHGGGRWTRRVELTWGRRRA
jgi:SAM-dependent methyltransferase